MFHRNYLEDCIYRSRPAHLAEQRDVLSSVELGQRPCLLIQCVEIGHLPPEAPPPSERARRRNTFPSAESPRERTPAGPPATGSAGTEASWILRRRKRMKSISLEYLRNPQNTSPRLQRCAKGSASDPGTF
eukprot:7657839-Pyramimonas_sp.AAC.1